MSEFWKTMLSEIKEITKNKGNYSKSEIREIEGIIKQIEEVIEVYDRFGEILTEAES